MREPSEGFTFLHKSENPSIKTVAEGDCSHYSCLWRGESNGSLQAITQFLLQLWPN